MRARRPESSTTRKIESPNLEVGAKVGEWTLLEFRRSKRPSRNAHWLVRCSCGVEREVQAGNLKRGISRSCGHNRTPQRQHRYTPGDKVGEWTLLDYHPGAKSPRVVPTWTCQCSCGTTRQVSTYNLAGGASRSCGHASRRFNRWEGYRPVTQ